MNMKPRISALRAITSRYALQTIRPLIITVAGVIGLLVALVTYLAYAINVWWLVFLLPLALVAIPVTAIAFAAVFLARRFAPPMNKEQRRATRLYVDNLNQVADDLQTPQFIIVFRVVRDVLRGRWEDGFIYGMTTNSVRLKKDFDALATLFDEA